MGGDEGVVVGVLGDPCAEGGFQGAVYCSVGCVWGDGGVCEECEVSLDIQREFAEDVRPVSAFNIEDGVGREGEFGVFVKG